MRVGPLAQAFEEKQGSHGQEEKTAAPVFGRKCSANGSSWVAALLGLRVVPAG